MLCCYLFFRGVLYIRNEQYCEVFDLQLTLVRVPACLEGRADLKTSIFDGSNLPNLSLRILTRTDFGNSLWNILSTGRKVYSRRVGGWTVGCSIRNINMHLRVASKTTSVTFLESTFNVYSTNKELDRQCSPSWTSLIYLKASQSQTAISRISGKTLTTMLDTLHQTASAYQGLTTCASLSHILRGLGHIALPQNSPVCHSPLHLRFSWLKHSPDFLKLFSLTRLGKGWLFRFWSPTEVS